MTSQEHKKHADVQKPAGGKIHRNEFAIIGAPCGFIQELSKKLNEELASYKVGYVDAAHGNDDPKEVYSSNYIDKIGFHQMQFDSSHVAYEFRSLFNDADLAIINGNHFLGDKQLVIINEKKKESLQKKLDRLTQPLAFLLDEGETEIHDYLKADYSELPVFSISDITGIANLIKMEITTPPIKGLVLAGGKSMRMGEDKGQIHYYGKPQREHTAELLAQFCEEIFISVREEEESTFPILVDSFADLGPYGGILSAFRYDPNAAWLVVATDIPLLDEATLKFLIEHRNPSKVATSFHNPETNFPEPLITLWEPRAYPRLLSFLAMGYTCPRKALINSDIEELQLDRKEVLFNANTPEEKQQLMAKING